MQQQESRFTQAREDCPHPEWWTADDFQGTEHQVTELVGAFVKALQPELVLETGSYKGQTSRSIANALLLNGHGRLVTIEMDRGLAADTRLFLKGYEEIATVMNCPSSAYSPEEGEVIDLCFIDSGPVEVRMEEFERFSRWFKRGTVVIFHDVADSPLGWFRTLREFVIELANEGRIGLIMLPTPRGLAICEFIK